MSEIIKAVAHLGKRLERRYEAGKPVQLNLKGYHPEFEIPCLDPLDLREYTRGSPNLIGRYPIKAMILAEGVRDPDELRVVSAIDGRGYYSKLMFGVVMSPQGLDNLFRITELPSPFYQD